MKYETNERNEIIERMHDLNISHNVLDIGCSDGGFICQLDSEFNIDFIDGVDIELPTEKCCERDNINFIQENFEYYSPDKKYNFIFMLDSLEHFSDHEKILKKVNKILSENGTLIISTPNFLFFPNILRIIISRDFKYQKIGTLDYTHLRFFTRKSLTRSLKSMGFSNISIVGINKFQYFEKIHFFPLFLFRPIIRLVLGKDYDSLQYLVVAKI